MLSFGHHYKILIEILALIHFGFFWRCGYRYESTRKNEGFKGFLKNLDSKLILEGNVLANY